jgi:hypothetical protein
MMQISGGIGKEWLWNRIEEITNRNGKYNICAELKKNLPWRCQDHIII